MRLRQASVILRSVRLLIPVLAVAVTAGAGPAGPASATATASSAGGANTFTVSGSVSGLYPGANLPLVLTVTDPRKYSITVSSITTTVSSQAAGCPSANLAVAAFTGNLSVAAKQSAHTTVMVQMLHTAPDACQGAHFKLMYSGTGTAG